MALPRSIPLYTRIGREIPNVHLLELHPQTARRVVEGHRKTYPTARLRRPPAGHYNCHGLTFANRRTCIPDPESVLSILEDDGYRKVKRPEVCLGDVAVYYEEGKVSHTGVIVQVERLEGLIGGMSIWIMSKWGQAAEYIHSFNDGPYREHRLQFWSDRP